MYKRNNLAIVFAIFSISFVILVGAVYYRTIVKGPAYKTLADAQYEYRVKEGDMNYLLTDSNNIDLMNYKKKYYVDIVYPDFLYNDVSSDEFITLDLILKNYNIKYDVRKLLNDSIRTPVSMEIDENIYEKLSKLQTLKGVYTYSSNSVDLDKAWTIENMIYSGIKSASEGNASNSSIDQKLFDQTKLNEFDEHVFTKDINRNIIVENECLNSKNVQIRTTLDKNVQDSIKNILNSDIYKNFAQIGVVVMDDKGKIKALTQKDDTLPNINSSVILYPGSIFKTVVEEAALENNQLSLKEKFLCKGINEGEDDKQHGYLNVSQAYSVSCNDIFTQIGNRIGGDEILKYARDQGILDKVLGLDLEEKGILDKNPEASDGSLGLTAIGQNLRITPLEALNIPSTIISGGKFIKPEIIDAVINGNNIESFTNDSEKIILSKSTADIMKNQMLDVVKNGTAKAAYSSKLEIGGKTGTTERKGDAPGDNRKDTMHSDGWFVGFFKADGRYYSMVVCVQDIDLKTQSGGNTAAEIFKQVALKYEEILKK